MNIFSHLQLNNEHAHITNNVLNTKAVFSIQQQGDAISIVYRKACYYYWKLITAFVVAPVRKRRRQHIIASIYLNITFVLIFSYHFHVKYRHTFSSFVSLCLLLLLMRYIRTHNRYSTHRRPCLQAVQQARPAPLYDNSECIKSFVLFDKIQILWFWSYEKDYGAFFLNPI